MTFLHSGLPRSGFLIFLKDFGRFNDRDLLLRLGINELEQIEELQPFHRFNWIVVANHDPWTLLGDGPGYWLWNAPTTHSAIESLAIECDLATWFRADCDDTFEVAIYRGGVCVRRLMMIEDGDSKMQAVVDEGVPLPEEAVIFAMGFSFGKALQLLGAVGVPIYFEEGKTRGYNVK